MSPRHVTTHTRLRTVDAITIETPSTSRYTACVYTITMSQPFISHRTTAPPTTHIHDRSQVHCQTHGVNECHPRRPRRCARRRRAIRGMSLPTLPLSPLPEHIAPQSFSLSLLFVHTARHECEQCVRPCDPLSLATAPQTALKTAHTCPQAELERTHVIDRTHMHMIIIPGRLQIHPPPNRCRICSLAVVLTTALGRL
jgi:hypothetical protein